MAKILYPNDYLKQARLLRGWSQGDVAGHIGTDGNTVNRWERGRAKPSPYFRQKLCELFNKSALELGLLSDFQQRPAPVLSASLESKPANYSYIPHRRNPFFTGREELLEILYTQLGPDQSVVSTPYALCGLGGIGKTQLAVEYAYRYASLYQAVFWIDAENIEKIVASYLAIARLLSLSESHEADPQHTVSKVQRWLSSITTWLLIWDNLENFDLVQRFLPSVYQGAILITTQKSAMGTLAFPLELPPFSPEEGARFLLHRTKLLHHASLSGEQTHQFAALRPEVHTTAREVTEVLGGLPLALDQVGAYIEETGCALSDYLKLYRQQRLRLMDRRGASGEDHPLSAVATIKSAIQSLAQSHPLSLDLLNICAFLNGEVIPEEFFVANPAQLDWSCASLVTDPLITDPYQFDRMIATLRNFSLIQRHPETRTLSVHRLVQAILQDQLNEQERLQWQQYIIQRLNVFFPESADPLREQCERFLPHVLACVSALPTTIANQTLAHLLLKTANYLREQGQNEQSEPLIQRALSILGRIVEPMHPLIAKALHNYALLYEGQGRCKQTEHLYLRTLHIQEQIFGSEHLLVAHLSNMLGFFFMERGKHEEAKILYKQALRIQKVQLGWQHPDTARSLAGLAWVYKEQGREKCARQLLGWACTIFEQRLGHVHPETVKAKNNYQCLFGQRRQTIPTRLERTPASIHASAAMLSQKSLCRELSLDERRPAPLQNGDSFKSFLSSCCQLHPHAWSRASDLWQAYERWVERHQGNYALSRQAFAAQLKAYGCQADRTSTARIWRGITILSK